VAAGRGRRLILQSLVGLALFLVLVALAAAFLGTSLPFGGDRIALVAVEGTITDARDIVAQLHRYRDQPNVKAVVLRIDSPGGAVAPSQEIYAEVVKLRQETGKLVVASLGGVAASGGYYVAAAADRIVANPGTITGSIGVIMQIPNLGGLLEKVGIRATVIKAGQFKDLASITRDLTEPERQILQGVMDDVHGQFIEAVATGRHLDRSKVEPLADGRIFSGRQALALGLVDELGDQADAVDRAAKLVGITGRPRIVQERRSRFSLWDLAREQLGLPGPGAAPPLSIQYLWQ